MNKSISYFLPILTYTFYSIFLYYPHNLHQVIICSKQVTNETFESKLSRESCAISGIKPISIWYKKRFYSAVNHSAGCFDCVNATEIINYQRDMSPLRWVTRVVSARCYERHTRFARVLHLFANPLWNIIWLESSNIRDPLYCSMHSLAKQDSTILLKKL